MCGIFGILGIPDGADLQALRTKAVALSKRIQHRGPDWSGVHVSKHAILCHERLAIVGVDSGEQPLIGCDDVAVCVNGEIYNHMELRKKLDGHKIKTSSDCEVIGHLYEQKGVDFIDELDGDFAFIAIKNDGAEFLAARDPIGVDPLYIGWHADGSIWFSSEMKCLIDDCQSIEIFPPGHYMTSERVLKRWYNRQWLLNDNVPTTPTDPAKIRAALENAVHKRMMAEVPSGILLSGGLDSSLVAAIAVRRAKQLAEAYTRNDSESQDFFAEWGPRLHSFSIGLEGSPDLIAAREAAKFLGTRHREFVFTVQQGIDALEEVIWHLETYDVTTIRASTPMFLLSRRIKAMGVKMVFSGEGSDEMFAGYLYFHKAPNREELHKETVRKLSNLHYYDCLRANKSTHAWGIEVRVPFLDKEFLDVVMTLDPALKMITKEHRGIEKYILRKAFDVPESEGGPYLPNSILWRQKEQFSDGVGYSWIDGVKSYADRVVSDMELRNAAHLFPVDPPQTKEALLYRRIFERRFPHKSAIFTVPRGPSIACSTPAAIAWDKAFANCADPSGRSVKVHVSSVVKDCGAEEPEAKKPRTQ